MKFAKKLIGDEEERAVSPVIGVILMVAITVILAAVIAAFVLDITPGGDSVQASVSFSGEQTSNVTVDITDSGNADQLVVIDNSGDVIHVIDPVNTGASHTMNASADLGMSTPSTEEFDMYAIKGDLSSGDPLDAASGNVRVGTFEVDNT